MRRNEKKNQEPRGFAWSRDWEWNIYERRRWGDGGNQKANRRAEGGSKERGAFLSFFPWIANGDRACKTIFKSPLIMNSLMNASLLRNGSLHSRVFTRLSFPSTGTLVVCTSTSGWMMDFREPPFFCFLGCVISCPFFFPRSFFRKEGNFDWNERRGKRCNFCKINSFGEINIRSIQTIVLWYSLRFKSVFVIKRRRRKKDKIAH